MAGAVWTGSAVAQAPSASLNTILAFTGSNGAAPACALIGDRSGAIYGTAGGGSAGAGVVFKLSPPTLPGASWKETVLYNFTGKADGGGPGTGLIFDTSGALYGSAFSGGASGNGVVFKLTPPASGNGTWTETVLFSFATQYGGTNPHAPLVFGSKGELYSTAGGGSYGYGVVFELKPPASGSGPWTEIVLHQFKGAGDGATPAGGLVIGNHGVLYGMTNFGGQYNAGTVYQLKPPSAPGTGWVESVLYSFSNGSDGSFPVGSLVFSTGGSAYGTTTAGGTRGFGTVFQLKPPSGLGGAWTESVLYSFLGGGDGSSPIGALVFGSNGALYGTTAYGGANSDGTVFALKPPGATGGPWTESVLHAFRGSDGQNPTSGVVFALNGAVFGVTEFGGSAGLGTVFELILK